MPVASQRGEFMPRGNVPQFGGEVIAAGGENLAVMAERQGPHGPVVPQSGALLASGHVPQLDGVVVAAGRDRFPVGGEGQGANHIGMAAEYGQLLP